ncbi:MAG: hypothetical protein KDA24_05270 [Deltaproteobacteria bacterium]|nr:hypothetical protein [Deltaproteobacteria bacterium]
MKHLALSILLVAAMSSTALAGTIRVQNGDSKTHTIELKCSGSSKKVEIKASTTASYTFHSTSDSCDIVGGSIEFPTKELEDGQKWTIKGDEAKPS